MSNEITLPDIILAGHLLKTFFNPEFQDAYDEKILEKYENLSSWGDEMYEKFKAFDLGGIESSY